MNKNIAEIKRLQEEANNAKRQLMSLARKMMDHDTRKAESLNIIIGRLEAWQNKK